MESLQASSFSLVCSGVVSLHLSIIDCRSQTILGKVGHKLVLVAKHPRAVQVSVLLEELMGGSPVSSFLS